MYSNYCAINKVHNPIYTFIMQASYILFGSLCLSKPVRIETRFKLPHFQF